MDKPSNYRRTRTRQTRLRKCPPTAWFAGRAELTWSELIVDDAFPSLLEAAAGGNPADLVDEDSFMEQRQDQVRALIEQGNLKEADRLCQEGLERFPGHALLWELLAGLEEARGNTEAAERTRNAAIEANRKMRNIVGDHPALDAVEVMLLGKAGRLEETVPSIGRLQEAGFDQPIYWNMLGGEHYKNQRFLEARRAFERAYAIATNDGMRELALHGLALLVDLRTNFLERCRAMGADPSEAIQQGGDEESVRFVQEVMLAGDLATPLESMTLDPSDPAFRPENYWPSQNPLPDDQIEVVIASIFMKSVQRDSVFIVAIPSPCGGIDYLVIKGHLYCPENEVRLKDAHSERPLSLAELIHMIDTAEFYGQASGLALGWLKFNLEMTGDADDLRGLVSIKSSFYPGIEPHYRHVCDAYLDEFIAQNTLHDGIELADDSEPVPSAQSVTGKTEDHQDPNKPPIVSPARLDAVIRFMQTSDKFAGFTRKELQSHLQTDPELPLALDMYRWSRLRSPVLEYMALHCCDEPRIHGRWRRYKRTPADIQDFEGNLQIVMDNPTVNGEELLALLPNRPELWESISNSDPEQAKPSNSGAEPLKTKTIYSQPFDLKAMMAADEAERVDFKQAMAARELKRQKDYKEASTNPQWLRFKQANKKPDKP